MKQDCKYLTLEKCHYCISKSIIYQRILIQSIDLVLCDSKFSFKCSKQFSISLYFATMVNKNQGQSLSKVGLYQSQPMITHGQLYVVVSKVTTKI